MDASHKGDVERIRKLRAEGLITEEEMTALLERVDGSGPMETEVVEPKETVEAGEAKAEPEGAVKNAPRKQSHNRFLVFATVAVLLLGAAVMAGTMSSTADNSAAKAYRQGLECEESGKPEEAKQWFLKAAEMGHPDAQLAVAYKFLSEKDQGNFFLWLQKAAASGCLEAMLQMGNNYRYGENGVEKDLDKAKEWYQKARDNGMDGEAIATALEEIEEEKSRASLPKTIQEVPNYLLSLIKPSYFPDYTAEDGYANVDRALNRFLSDGKWVVYEGYFSAWGASIYDVLRDLKPFRDMDSGFLRRQNEFFKEWLNGPPKSTEESEPLWNWRTTKSIVESYRYLIYFEGIGPNLEDESKKARYKVYFLIDLDDYIDCGTVEYHALMNGREIEFGDFLAKIYLNSK